MGATTPQWKQLAADTRDILGDPWEVAGSGRKTILVRRGIGWWQQHISYEPTTLGRFIAYSGFLGKPLAYTQIGDSGGTTSDRFPSDPRQRRSRDLHDPQALADWILAVASEQFDTVPDLNDHLTRLEEVHHRRAETPVAQQMFSSRSLQLLVMLRVICGTRSREGLLADIDDVLADPDTALRNPATFRRADGGPTYPQFFTSLRGIIAAADRPAMQQLILDTRRDNLRHYKIPESWVSGVTFPAPEHPW
ncbi:hypothetical protein [Gordonia lacunae]|nr:hypothetical protein [Gordonia lacunae]